MAFAIVLACFPVHRLSFPRLKSEDPCGVRFYLKGHKVVKLSIALCCYGSSSFQCKGRHPCANRKSILVLVAPIGKVFDDQLHSRGIIQHLKAHSIHQALDSRSDSISTPFSPHAMLDSDERLVTLSKQCLASFLFSLCRFPVSFYQCDRATWLSRICLSTVQSRNSAMA